MSSRFAWDAVLARDRARMRRRRRLRVIAAHQCPDHATIARRTNVEEAVATDAAETISSGEARGDELPEVLATRAGREGWLRAARQRARLSEAKRRLEEERFDFAGTSLGFEEVVELVETALKEGELIQLPPDETKRVLNPQQIVSVERM